MHKPNSKALEKALKSTKKGDNNEKCRQSQTR
jgi:hypothetical protein